MGDLINAIADFFQTVFSPVVAVLGEVLLFFHFNLGAPWWLAIAMLTIVVRTLMFPLTVKQVKSMRAMQDLKPEMDKIRAQYKDNRPKQQEEMMKLYQERNINPLGGCLPILVQMPVFIGIFYVIRLFGGIPGQRAPQYESFTEGGILWFKDLSHMDPYFILPVLSALTMLAATEITAKNIDPQQRWLMRLLPIGITVFLWSFPAGLFVYWITSNLVTLAQNYLIYNHGPGRKPAMSGAASRAQPDKTSAADASTGDDAAGGAKSGQGAEDAAARAAKVAKRKRRKKKR
ncbi:MAG TPA: membrane protein insertase YidC [Rubrobacteraceae bacterium]|nr:membrane protein insertase YidC [Rubrobacteraceae bacterium]